jgi:metal-responsive CopG/Arc/MetJ family transcriptional regulator
MEGGPSKSVRTPGRRLGESNRVSVTFPADHYRRLNEIAEQEGVSTAGVVRWAVREYLARASAAKKRKK